MENKIVIDLTQEEVESVVDLSNDDNNTEKDYDEDADEEGEEDDFNLFFFLFKSVISTTTFGRFLLII